MGINANRDKSASRVTYGKHSLTSLTRVRMWDCGVRAVVFSSKEGKKNLLGTARVQMDSALLKTAAVRSAVNVFPDRLVGLPRPAHAAAASATATYADFTKRGCGRDGAKPKTKPISVNATV